MAQAVSPISPSKAPTFLQSVCNKLRALANGVKQAVLRFFQCIFPCLFQKKGDPKSPLTAQTVTVQTTTEPFPAGQSPMVRSVVAEPPVSQSAPGSSQAPDVVPLGSLDAEQEDPEADKSTWQLGFQPVRINASGITMPQNANQVQGVTKLEPGKAALFVALHGLERVLTLGQVTKQMLDEMSETGVKTYQANQRKVQMQIPIKSLLEELGNSDSPFEKPEIVTLQELEQCLPGKIQKKGVVGILFINQDVPQDPKVYVGFATRRADTFGGKLESVYYILDPYKNSFYCISDFLYLKEFGEKPSIVLIVKKPERYE